MITTRLASSADAALIADMSRKTFYDTFAAYNTPEDMEKFMNEQFTREMLMEEVGKPGNFFILAYYNEEPAGYARVRENNHAGTGTNDAIEIARIYAIHEMIGKGIGRVLMQTCIDMAYKLNKKVIWLGVWEKNERAIAFYQQWGFHKFSGHDFRLGNDLQHDWLMLKQLDTAIPG